MQSTLYGGKASRRTSIQEHWSSAQSTPYSVLPSPMLNTPTISGSRLLKGPSIGDRPLLLSSLGRSLPHETHIDQERWLGKLGEMLPFQAHSPRRSQFRHEAHCYCLGYSRTTPYSSPYSIRGIGLQLSVHFLIEDLGRMKMIIGYPQPFWARGGVSLGDQWSPKKGRSSSWPGGPSAEGIKWAIPQPSDTSRGSIECGVIGPV